jgi:predicted DNA-binding transcriptional regulator AlpA
MSSESWFCEPCARIEGRHYLHPHDPDIVCAKCGAAISREERELLLRRQVLELERQLRSTLDLNDLLHRKLPEPKATYMPSEVATLIGGTLKSVYARHARGQLPGGFKIGRSLRFRGPELLRWLTEGRAPSSKR